MTEKKKDDEGSTYFSHTDLDVPGPFRGNQQTLQSRDGADSKVSKTARGIALG